MGEFEKNEQRQRRNAGVSPLHCAPVEMTAFGGAEENKQRQEQKLAGKGCAFPNRRPIRRGPVEMTAFWGRTVRARLKPCPSEFLPHLLREGVRTLV